MRRHASERAGFTLAEAAITIVLVGLVISTTLQILQGTKFTAAHTRDMKAARDLGLMTLAEIESGLWWDDIESTRSGSYAEDDHPAFYFDLALGDETFPDEAWDDEQRPFDNWEYQRQLEQDRLEEEDEEEQLTEPFEKVRVRITFPRYGELPNQILLERWIPWEQVYGPDEEQAQQDPAAQQAGPGQPPAGQPGGSQDGR